MENEAAGASNEKGQERSPWSVSYDGMDVEISPSLHPVNGQISIPGSKSVTNRALIIAALADGTSTIRNILRSDDSYWCLNSLRELGVRADIDGNNVQIDGIAGNWPNKNGSLFLGASGTLARFLPGVLSVCKEGNWSLTGTSRLNERPILPLVEALRDFGGVLSFIEKQGHLPVKVEAQGLKGGEASISGAVSSQFLSGLLLASPYAQSPTIVRVPDGIVQQAYVDLTLELMQTFGVSVEHDSSYSRFDVYPQVYRGRDFETEADASTCCYFLAYTALTGGHITVVNISSKTKQPDLGMLELFERMGCVVSRKADSIELWSTGQLKGGGFTVSMREMSDQTLTIAAMAPFMEAPVTMTDVAHIREHECDRIKAMCGSLRQLGIRADEYPDGMTVYPGTPHPAVLHTHNDHRVAMSLALIGSRVAGIRLKDPACVSKTCPAFFEDMRKLGLQVKAVPV